MRSILFFAASLVLLAMLNQTIVGMKTLWPVILLVGGIFGALRGRILGSFAPNAEPNE